MSETERSKRLKGNPEAQAVAGSLARFSAVESTAKSEGGQYIQKILKKDIFSSVEMIATKYDELTLQEFVALGASLKSNLDILHIFTRAKGRAKMKREELEQLLTEEVES